MDGGFKAVIMNRNINVKANNVTVSQNKRKKRRRNKKRLPQSASSNPLPAFNKMAIGKKYTRPAPPLPVTPVSGGRMTEDPVAHDICGETLCPGESALGWYYKYMDPAGAVESGRALGEFTKIPDGLLRFSVDAEQRTVNTEEAPGVTDTLPLAGNLWSATIISFPCFRLNYIIVANLDNNSMSPEVATAFISTINNMVNWRDNVTGAWIQFYDRWFYKIRVHPNTYDMTDAGDRTDSVTQFRLTCKGVTTEFNAPTLIDQGWWVGGHVPIKPRVESIPATDSTSEGTASVNVVGIVSGAPAFPATWNFSFPPLRTTAALTMIGSGSVLPTVGLELSFQVTSGGVGSGVSFEVGSYLTHNDAPWAAVGDIVSIVLTSSTGTTPTNLVSLFLLTNETNDAIPSIELSVGGFGQAFEGFVVGQAFNGFNRLSLDLPALTPDQLIVNNPKIEQFLCKESGGSYLVHYKMANPVFEMTGEENFGAFRFHYPSYDLVNNADSLRGIIDTWENNFTTAVCHFQGISTSASLVVKTYMGWEGTTNAGGTLGQFAHTGLDDEPELLHLAEKLQEDLTGVYEENDNMAATVALIAGNALSNLMKGEATTSVIKGVANSALGAVAENPSIIGSAIKGIGNIGARLVNSIKNRRRRRRLRQ